MSDIELEVKYYVYNLKAIESHLQNLDAKLIQARTHEMNLHFDTPSGEMAQGFKVLRLRQDTAARLTFKGPSESQDGVRVRQEIEFTVGDFSTARRFLEALGYQVSMIYEKYRCVYELDGVQVTLDEMPYGDFVEIEGPDTSSIKRVNERLGLDWERRAPASYSALFDRIREQADLPFRHLVFENFKELDITPEIIGVQAAD